MKKALITGICGQDGSYLAEYLLKSDYEVHGITRGYAGGNIIPGVHYHIADMRDFVTLENTFRKVWPDEVYNLAGQVFVPTSWMHPEETFDINVGGLTRLLRIVEALKPDTRVYQASSSEMFGNQNGALNEQAKMEPVSPYGVSKYAAHCMVDVYRNRGLWVCAGILFNHESPRRGTHMVTRKITQHVARWANGEKDKLKLGNLNAVRDWGHAADYVRAMHKMLQQDRPQDFVVGTGETHTVEEFLIEAVEAAHLEWSKYKDLVVSNTKEFSRTNELHFLKADWKKAEVLLKWAPNYSFGRLVEEMVQSDRAGLEVYEPSINVWTARSGR